MKQISAGDQQVWAVDTQNKLYRRRDIMPILPEGTGWDLVAENVLHVSIGKNDEVTFFRFSIRIDERQSIFTFQKTGLGRVRSRLLPPQIKRKRINLRSERVHQGVSFWNGLGVCYWSKKTAIYYDHT